MDSEKIFSRTPFPNQGEWNELHVVIPKKDTIKLYVNNRIYDHSIDLKKYLINNSVELEIEADKIILATLYYFNSEDQIKTIKEYYFP